MTEFIVKLNNAGSATAANYTGGEGAGSSWTDKVMSFKGQQDVPQDEGDGAEDDEWVSIRLEFKVGALATSLWCVSSGKTGVLMGIVDQSEEQIRNERVTWCELVSL